MARVRVATAHEGRVDILLKITLQLLSAVFSCPSNSEDPLAVSIADLCCLGIQYVQVLLKTEDEYHKHVS